MYLLDTAKDIFDVILQVGAGTGLLYLVRWFWWRVNAWCEIVAMVSSFLGIDRRCSCCETQGVVFSTHVALLVTVAITTVCWVATAYLGPETDRDVLIRFWKHVRPAGPGGSRSARWPACRRARVADRDNMPLALLGWVAGCTAIWSALFAEGNYPVRSISPGAPADGDFRRVQHRPRTHRVTDVEVFAESLGDQ